IELFEKALYAVQIGDFPALRPYADDQLVAKQNQPQAVAAKILQVFAEFRGK
ncbi:MAG: HAD family hydrolase, partial [Streptococcus sp.]